MYNKLPEIFGGGVGGGNLGLSTGFSVGISPAGKTNFAPARIKKKRSIISTFP